VLFGDMGGNFYAVDATDGQKLWGQKIGGAIGGGVITGTQKIAVATGLTEVLWPTKITTARVSILGLDIGKLKSNSRFKMRREKLKTGFACVPQKGDPSWDRKFFPRNS
jgi:outer membrane protein assembly factor BamB